MPDGSLRDLFLLDPDVTFLNHGSFGACPRPVFEAYQRWQLALEREPVDFLSRRADGLLAEARAALGAYLHADPESLTFVPNATAGMNTVARSLDLRPGDEILTTDHEYGAVDLTWRYVERHSGAKVVRAAIPLPVTTPAAFVDQLWSRVTPRTRLISISHITSPTALIFPVAEVCRRARAAGILTAVDGAHAPGQIDLDLEALGADFYTGNCHKWLCAPKGSAFLYARPEHHAQLDPVIISWGWEEGNSFVQRTQWQGTRDLAAFLAVPDAIAFQQAHNWAAVRAECHTLALETRRRMAEQTGLAPISPDSAEWIGQMAAMLVPGCDAQELARHLWEDHRIEIPVVQWGGRTFVRISVQGYNTPAEADRLLAALGELLPVR